MKLTLPFFLLSFLFVQTGYAQTPELWGVTSGAGVSGSGALIKINGDGSNLSTAFTMSAGTGSFPGGHLVLGSNHLFYGMAFQGGAHNDGALFSFDPATSTYTDLYDLNNLNATWANADLIKAGDTALYGLIYNGGDNQEGNIFRFNPLTLNYTVAFHFTDSTTGQWPRNIMLGKDNKLYGTTDGGGAFNNGTIFSFDPSTGIYADVHDFDSINGSKSTGAILQAANGKIYGLTGFGGIADSGIVFSFNPGNNAFSKIHDFHGADGSPFWNNGLTEATNGQLYGITFEGGSKNNGVIFSIDTTGLFTKRYDLTGSNGYGTIGKMICASDGKLYGITSFGGTHGLGTVFSFETAGNTFTKLTDLTTEAGGNAYGYLTELPATAGVTTLYANHNLKVYPNPAANNSLFIDYQLQATAAEVIDLLGKQYMEQTLLPEARETVLNISGLTAGIYFVVLHTKNGNSVTRFVKE